MSSDVLAVVASAWVSSDADEPLGATDGCTSLAGAPAAVHAPSVAWDSHADLVGAGMHYTRCVATLLGGFAMLLLGGFSSVRVQPASSISEPAKLGFSYLSRAQVQDLWRRADTYALAEVFLKQCGSPSHIERRMMLAARDCIEAQALNRVAAFFRRKVAELSSRYTFVCDTDQSKALVKTTRARIERDIEEVRSMCRACLIC